MKKFIVLSIVLLMLAGFAITSSAKGVTLLAGKDINVGTLTVEVVGDDLVVTYNITSPWLLEETHLYVGTSPPTKSAPGQFPYGPGGAVYTIDLDGFTGILWIAAHAVVTNPEELDNCESREETAWAFQCELWRIHPNKNWATYFCFRVPE